MNSFAVALLGVSLVSADLGPVVVEPKTGTTFPVKNGRMTLLGVGLRTKTFLKFKVYSLGLYVSDAALTGPLVVHKGKLNTSAFYRDLVTGDFEKQFVLKLVRNVSAEQIRAGFRDYMHAPDKRLLDQFLSYWSDAKAGQECVMHWIPGGRLETTVNGVVKPPIANKEFADEVFAVWLSDRATEDKLRKQLVSRASGLVR